MANFHYQLNKFSIINSVDNTKLPNFFCNSVHLNLHTSNFLQLYDTIREIVSIEDSVLIYGCCSLSHFNTCISSSLRTLLTDWSSVPYRDLTVNFTVYDNVNATITVTVTVIDSVTVNLTLIVIFIVTVILQCKLRVSPWHFLLKFQCWLISYTIYLIFENNYLMFH